MTGETQLTIAAETAQAALAEALVLTICGRLDHRTADELRRAIDAGLAAHPGCGALVLDLADVDFMASAGLRALLYARRVADGAGVTLALVGFSAQVSAVFEVSRFADLFQPYASVNQALAALDAGAAPGA